MKGGWAGAREELPKRPTSPCRNFDIYPQQTLPEANSSSEKPMPADLKEEKRVLQSFIAVRAEFLFIPNQTDLLEPLRKAPMHDIHLTVNEGHHNLRYAAKKETKDGSA
jgi:hypothetical protein